MNEKQKQWLELKVLQLDQMLDTGREPTDEEWENAAGFVDMTVQQAKGKTEDKRPEVRKALLNILEKWERYYYGK